MQRITTIGVALMAMFAFAVVVASSAQAADPIILLCKEVTAKTGLYNDQNCLSDNANKEGNWERKIAAAGEKAPFTIKSGSGTLGNATGSTISCTSDEGTGEIVGPDSVANVVVIFHGCIGKEGEKECTVKSTNTSSKGLIVTNTLKGEYGLVATGEAASGVGTYLEPATGKVFVTIEKASCALEAPVDGSVAGENSPINAFALSSILLLVGSAGNQKIKKITTLKGELKPELSAFGLVKASEQTREELTSATAVEIM